MPHWSPDGKQIAFFGSPAGKPPRIYIVSSDGNTLRQESHGESGAYGDVDPSWSPDGTSLAFGATSDSRAPEEPVRVVDLKTNHISVLPGSQRMLSPRWSPDGHFLAGLSGYGWKLILYDLRTQKQTELFSQSSGYPNWSQDGEFLFFASGQSWWRVRIRDRRVERVNNLKEFSPADVGWFALAPDNSLITARNVGTDEIYALDWDLP